MELAERADTLPTGPGVYLFKSAAGRVLYVGKAQNLRARVRSYLGGGDGRPRIPLLVERSDDVDVIVTASVKDALLLENELIKRHKPPFNVRLRDDKQYLALRLDARETLAAPHAGPPLPPGWGGLLRPLHVEHRDARIRLEPAPDLPAALVPRGRLPGLRAARAALHRVRDEALPGALLRARLARGLRRAGARHDAVPARSLGRARRDAASAHAGGRGRRALRGRRAPAQPDPGGGAHRRAPADGDAASDRPRRVRARAPGRRDRGAGAARARRTRDGHAGLRLLGRVARRRRRDELVPRPVLRRRGGPRDPRRGADAAAGRGRRGARRAVRRALRAPRRAARAEARAPRPAARDRARQRRARPRQAARGARERRGGQRRAAAGARPAPPPASHRRLRRLDLRGDAQRREPRRVPGRPARRRRTSGAIASARPRPTTTWRACARCSRGVWRASRASRCPI